MTSANDFLVSFNVQAKRCTMIACVPNEIALAEQRDRQPAYRPFASVENIWERPKDDMLRSGRVTRVPSSRDFEVARRTLGNRGCASTMVFLRRQASEKKIAIFGKRGRWDDGVYTHR